MNSPNAVAEAVPRPAATVVLLREQTGILQALLLRRLASMSFAAGEWVFPGGVVDGTDAAPELLRRTSMAEVLDPREQARRIAACRETFEECGVLLAHHTNTASDALKQALKDPERNFFDLLRRHDLCPAVDQLVLWSNWVTPALSPRRFDTFFYAVAMPAGQEIRLDPQESQDARWIDVRDPSAVMPTSGISPATMTLQEMALRHRELGSLTRMLDAARAAPVPRIMMKIFEDKGQLSGLMPWDSNYPAAPGAGVDVDANLLQRFGAFPSRFAIDPASMPRRR